MTPRKNMHPTDDDIETDALAKRNDPSAWEILPDVPPSSSPRPSWMLRNKHLEIAAEFHVLSVLHRLGLEANLALAQPDNVDIVALGTAGQTITIDVKTVDGTRDWAIDPFAARRHHYVVVVSFAADSTVQPRTFIVASETLRNFISQRQLTSIPLETFRRDLAALEAWQLITAEQAA